VLIEPSIPAVIALNIAAWLVIQFGLAWWMTRLPVECFDAQSFFARTKSWERCGKIYENLFCIKSWKDRLPDASRMFRGGFAKAELKSASADYFKRFMTETWRGEVTHWLALIALPIFCVWNPWWGVLINAAVVFAVNVPCILAQRYNRARFARVIEKHSQKTVVK
jgi:glycosyl-4,4'-diaponeurosporenoate acyltransferase